eukprot:1159341-Pelagomonas_calceolata.AAC.12
MQPVASVIESALTPPSISPCSKIVHKATAVHDLSCRVHMQDKSREQCQQVFGCKRITHFLQSIPPLSGNSRGASFLLRWISSSRGPHDNPLKVTAEKESDLSIKMTLDALETWRKHSRGRKPKDKAHKSAHPGQPEELLQNIRNLQKHGQQTEMGGWPAVVFLLT